MRILTLTTLYPNAAAPAHGIFVENRMKDFAARSRAEIRVVAPVPFFPFGGPLAGRYAAYAEAPNREARAGFEIRHPRYLIPPKVGMTYAADALTRCFLKAARDLLAVGWDFDVIDGHYLYPDGVAAARVGKALGKPVVLTARGSDVTFLPRFPRQRQMILEAVYAADAVVTVAESLKDELIRIGAPAENIRVLRNGVDLQLFRPLDRRDIRIRHILPGPTLLSVGHLIERKGHHLVIDALEQLPGTTLLIVGKGEERERLGGYAATLGVADRVRFLGAVPHERLAEIYNAADALVLASSREGWPNVLLEAMACGTPVVATPVWGSSEAITAPEAGQLAAERSAPAIAAAIRTLFDDPPDRAATRLYAERYSWAETSAGLRELFKDVVAARTGDKARRVTPIAVAKPDRPQMIVTIDTEERFDWARFDKPPMTVSPAVDIDRFQMLAASFGARPLYLMTQPVIEDADCAAYFRMLKAREAADLGLHLHQWTSPPFSGYDGEYYSWQCNLPLSLQRQKIRALAASFETAFGYRARAHRAGRYGIDARAYAALAEVGIDLDFSPSPAFDYGRAGGPDFSAMSVRPFAVEVGGGRIAVTPTSGARMLRGASIALANDAPAGFAGRKHRALRKLAAPLRLSPEGTRLKDLEALTRRLVADGAPVLTFSLHSTSLTPGATQYARDSAGVDALLAACRGYFEFFTRDLGGVFIPEADAARLYEINAS